MRDQDDLAEPQGLNHGRKIAKLLLEAIGCVIRLVGCAKAQEIERNSASASLGQLGNKIVIDVKVVGKAGHQHEGRASAIVVVGANSALAARNAMLGETWLVVHGVLVEAAIGVQPAAFRCQGSARKGYLDWIFATLSFLKTNVEAKIGGRIRDGSAMRP